MRHSPYNPEDDMDERNEQMLSSLSEQTAELRRVAGSLHSIFQNGKENLQSLTANVETSGTMMERSRRYLSTVTDDPTYFGVFKIAMLVFWSLTITYFGLKFLSRFVFKK